MGHPQKNSQDTQAQAALRTPTGLGQNVPLRPASELGEHRRKVWEKRRISHETTKQPRCVSGHEL